MNHLFKNTMAKLSIFTVIAGLTLSMISPKVHAADPEYVLGFGDSGAGGLIFAVDAYKDLRPFLLNIQSKYQVQFVINHIGDTANAPYGQRTPEDIRRLTKNFVGYMVNDAHSDIAVIACNTASTVVDDQLENEFQDLYPDSPVMPIIVKSAQTVYKRAKVVKGPNGQKEIHIGVLATPATVASGQYQKALAAIHAEKYGKEGVKLHTYFYGPKTWVRNVEFGATVSENKAIVAEDLTKFLETPNADKVSVIGLFCTHYPFFKSDITQFLDTHGVVNVPLISQGKIFADRIRTRIEADIKAGKIKPRKKALDIKKVAQPKIYSNITGDNLAEIKNVLEKIAPDLADQVVYSKVSIKELK